MSVQVPVKRQRIGDASDSLPSRRYQRPLSSEQHLSIRHAQCIDNGNNALEQLQSLRSGFNDLGQIAWSPHNLLATASNSQHAPSTSASGHIVVQYPVSSSSRKKLKPSHLYPEQSSFTSTPQAGPSQSRPAANNTPPQTTRYGDPRHISFSPCGYYLCAYFPVSRRPTAPSKASPEATNGLSQEPLSQPGTTATALDATLALPQTAAPTSPSPPETSTTCPSAKFCIWSRAETGSLNDWKLVQTLSVKPAARRTGSAASAKPDNVLKVNERGQPVARNGLGASPSDLESAEDSKVLQGGIEKVVWLNRRRRIVLRSGSSSSNHYGASAFTRLAARGPSFLPAASASIDNSAPDQDVALVVFGNHGQVTLLSSRKADREAASTTESSSSSIAPPAFFMTLLSTSLYTPTLQPSPITLDSTHSLDDKQGSNNAARYDAPFSRINGHDSDPEGELGDSDCITHLAVGMPANDSVLLVASKQPSNSSSLVDLTEIAIDLRGESITMTTRPLQSVSLSSADLNRLSGSPDNRSTGVGHLDLDKISILTWAEVDATGSDEDIAAGKAGSLRLIACSSHVESTKSVTDSADHGGTAPTMRSDIACWDLFKAENEFSDAFASLECRKTGYAPKWSDWQLRFVQSKRLHHQLVTSFVANADGMALTDFAILTALTSTPGKPGLLAEQLCYFDLERVDVAAGVAVTVPTHAISRSSNPVISSNGTLIATFSSSHSGSSDKGVVLWKLPQLPRDSGQAPAGASDMTRQMSQLLALSALRKSDPSDIGRASGSATSQGTSGNLLIEIGDLLKITESKRQDVLVKIEGATQKGPSHDSNSIPFHQALRLLKIRMAIGVGKWPRLERLVLELGLCFQVLRLARVKTQVTVTPTPAPTESGKKKSGAAAKAAAPATVPTSETRDRVYYRLESVWPLIAQLQWFLTLLDGVSKLALANRDAQSKSDSSDSFEMDFVRMLNKPTPRRLVLQILAHFCDFQEWVVSTTRKENLPPATTGEEMGTTTSDKVLAVSEQMALARDALHRVEGDAAVDLIQFTHLLAKVEVEATGGGAGGASGVSQSREVDRFWWATLDGSKVDQLGADVKVESDAANGLQAKLLSALIDPKSGAFVDVLSLFISPEDLSDERNVLYEKGADDTPTVGASTGKDAALMDALSAMSGKHSDDEARRDIVRKVSMSGAVTQSAILNDASTLLRSHPTTTVPGADTSDGNLVRIDAMRAKRCVRCSALSQDPVTVTYSVPHPTPSQANPAFTVDPSLPPQVQMQVQMQMQMQMQMMQMMQMQQAAAAAAAGQQGGVVGQILPFVPPMAMVQPPPRLLSIELGRASGADACVCGGQWWVL